VPGALHIAWWSPGRRLVKALAVDNEPASFWTGQDEEQEIAAWRRTVGFRVGEWGEVATSVRANAWAGRWLDENILAPLGVTRDEACLSTCVDTYFTDGPMVHGLADRYQPWAREVGLPEARLAPHLRDGALVELAVTEHRERLLHELSVVVPELVVTLGSVPLRVLRAITETKQGPAKLRPDAGYGVEHPLVIGRRSTIWLPLTAVGTPAEYAEAHSRWSLRARGQPSSSSTDPP
jgi:hypothetical protein